MTRSCARRSLAAETIFMALVICCVLRTDRMRRRMSIKLGMDCYGLLFLGGKALFELLDGVLQVGTQRFIERFLFPKLRPDRRVGVVDKGVKALFELAAAFHRQVVQVSARTGEDDGYLSLHGQRLELGLLQDLDQPD